MAFQLLRIDSRTKGLVLVEAVFAVVLVATTSLAFVAALIFSARQSETNSEHLYAVHLAGKWGHMLRAANPTRLGDQTTSGTAFERQFYAPQIVPGDPTHASVAPQYTVTCRFTGWGAVSSAATNSLTASFPTGVDPWIPGEWVGHYVTITEGTGRTQIMRITGNTASTLAVTADLTGATTTPWTRTPDSTSRFFINDGRTVRVRVTWGDGSRHQTVDRTVFIRRVS